MGENCDTVYQSFILHMNPDNFNHNGGNYFTHNSTFNDWHNGCGYKTDTTTLNEVIISKLDIENRTLSARFDFQLISADCLDTLKITEGRFDVAY